MRIAVDERIRSCIDSFVTELHDLVKEAAVASVTAAFGTAPGAVRVPVSETKKKRGATKARTSAGRSSRKRQRRDPSALAALTEKLGKYIAKTPGKRIEDIGRELGTTTKQLQLPARKLIVAGRVSTRGVKRATTYFPA